MRAVAALPALWVIGYMSGGEPLSAAQAQRGAGNANGVLEAVVDAMGTENLSSITLEGGAWRVRNGWMQTPTASPPWPSRDAITNYRRTIDLDAPASYARGDTFASDIFNNPPTAGTYTQNIRADQAGWTQQLEIWLTPWGFLEGAEENDATLATGKFDGVEYRMLTWRSPESQTSPSGMRYTVNGYINDDNLVAAVETWVEDAFMGDFHIAQTYSGYREIDGVMVPTEIEQHRAGGGIFGVLVTDADANPANLTELMAAPAAGGGRAGGPGRGGPGGPPRAGGPGGPGGRGGQAAAAPDLVTDLGGGAYLNTGGYVALLTEFEDHVIVFEAGQPESRGDQILAEVRKITSKPIRYVVNSHPHSDHSAGIIPFVREGVTLVTHENNVDFMRMALGAPRTLLGQPNLNPKVEGVSGVKVYEDGMNRLELHSVPNGHSDGMLVAYLPKQKVMFQADFSLPAAGAEANPFVKTLATYVDENNLDFERYSAVHAANTEQFKKDLLAAIGK
jgi:glyoxylase-like metal-dependent hydrolase (beta-lactamase superfamily II)